MEINGLGNSTGTVTAIQPKQPERIERQPDRPAAEVRLDTSAAGQSNKSVDANVVMAKFQSDKNAQKEREASASMLTSAIETANKQLVNAGRMLQASVHEKTNRLHVKIIDTDTNEVVREIPPEKTLDLFAKVLEMAGILVDERK